jgi:hypothetical protein
VRKILPVSVIVAAVLSIGGLIFLDSQPGAENAADGQQGGAEWPAPGSVSLRDKLDSGNAEVNILIVGDDSGKTMGGWLYLTAQEIGKRSGRAVVIADWEPSVGEFSDRRTTVWRGSGAQVTVYNASPPLSIQYINDNLAKIVPKDTSIDLVLISNGMSATNRTLARASVALQYEMANLLPAASFAFIVQPTSQQGDLDPSIAVGNAEDLRNSALNEGIPVIDVWKIFQRSNSIELFVSGSRYPSIEGYRVWASAVSAALYGVPAV